MQRNSLTHKLNLWLSQGSDDSLQSAHGKACCAARRGGAVIIVVLALLSLMIFLGVFFFEFVQEELTAAGNYATNPYDELLNPDEFFEEADTQLILGPDSSRTMSALSAGDIFTTTPPTGMTYGTPGSPHSLLAHVIGRMQPTINGVTPTDVLPHNGHGISASFLDNNADGLYGPGDYARFDMDGDGNPDAALDPTDAANLGLPVFGINFSRPAQNDPSVDAFGQISPSIPLRPFQPDVDYTYPDINNLFLAYDRIDQLTGRRILVPSFHRPDLFPTKRNSNFSDLYTDSNTKRLVLRPHSSHMHNNNTTPRFLTDYTQAQSGNLDRVIGPFPMSVDFDKDGIPNEMGVYSSASSDVGYDLDVDLTGDGEPDGIWMDLGMGLYDMADGRQFVPMFSFYVLDADSLINLNAHGNLREGYFNGSVAYTAAPFSVSNTGASASEVNPIRALTGNPGDFSGQSDLSFVQQEHAYYFSYPTFPIFPGNTPQSRGAMANMELSFLLRGRPLSRSGAPQTGRYGEESLAGNPIGGTLPRPGYTGSSGFDDDLDNTPSDARYRGGARRYPSLYDPRLGGNTSVVIPHSTHPVDQHGSGASAYTSTSAGRDLVAGVSGSPVVWPSYLQGWEAPQAASGIPGTVVPPIEAAYPYGGPLFANGTSTMIDEEDETRLASPDRRADDIFPADENLALQVSGSDYLRVGGTSRLKTLAPFNFNYSRDSADIRKRFTTDSWDLSELTYTPWRYNSSTGRTETSVWTSGRRFFPPDFVGVSPTAFTANDPFRPELRALLACEDTDRPNPVLARRENLTIPFLAGSSSGGTAQIWRQPINLNKLLVGFDTSGYPVYRDLMPHPDIRALEYVDTGTTMPTLSIPAMIHSHDGSVQPIPAAAALSVFTAFASNASPTDSDRAAVATAQEWWARYDRQRMARDIYTLLYLIGAPSNIDPTTTAYPNPEVVREMAQFAVNYVDALDRDDVITKFEYDDNLSDGWNTSPTRSVYGVERTSLTFSEVQFIQTAPQTSDYTRTLHNDSTDIHQYLHMELRNSSPFVVDLAEGWRISRVLSGTGTRDCSVEFKTKGFGSGTPKQISPGANFLIGTHDGFAVNGTSDFYADISGSSELESVLPNSTNTITNNSIRPNPQTDLDLGVVGMTAPYDHEQYYGFYLSGDSLSTYTGIKLVQRIQPSGMPSTPPVPAQVQFDLVLERRQNLNGIEATPNTPISSSMGEWIEVDRFHVNSDDMDTLTQFAQFDPSSDNQANIATALQTLNSVERRQTFDPVQVNHAASSTINHSMNVDPTTKNAANAALSAISLTQFQLWQPHFDRDFTSIYELLSVPLYGNWPLTELSNTANLNDGYSTNTFYKEIHGGTQFNLAPGSNGSGSGRMTGDFTAGMRFNFPNGIPGKPYQGWNLFTYQNAWYRLFDFVTVPRRADQQSEELISGVPGSTKPVFRVPGKVNLNTLRDETVLAALLDDEIHLTYGNTYATNDTLTANRNWFLELLASRDGTDYFANAAGLPQLAIPNSINSIPFRNSSKPDPYATSTVDDGVENGLLRSSPRRGGTALDQRPAGSAYSTPGLTSPANFTATGLWSGAPPHDTTFRNWQGLFDSGDLTSSTGMDHHTRNRILAKIANNSTTKSHVFFIWTAVGYFEAHRESTNNRVQIGARLTDIPIHRRFTVVDMSKLDEYYNASSNTFVSAPPYATPFIIFQKRLR